MKVRINNQWVDAVDFDGCEKVVIKVTKWFCLSPVPRAYFAYPLSPKILWNYRTIGLKNIVRKVVSRRKNDDVSQRYISIGKGIVERPEGAFKIGDNVVFAALNHPEGLTRIALATPFVRAIKSEESGDTKWARNDLNNSALDFLNHVGGFDLESGSPVPEISFSKIEDVLSKTTFSEVSVDSFPSASSRVAANNRQRSIVSKITIFGWGHHARTQISPNIPAPYFLSRVHDIDPLVLKLAGEKVTIDATRKIASDDDSSVLIVAGYHHTHTDLVLEGLKFGKAVICEKPLATSWEQFAQLEKLVTPKLVMAYHRRYDAFFDYIREDLSPESSKIDYRCVVHEVSLPENHWYNWPVSKSKIVSNGCHWIDHFLALKPGLKVVELDAFKNAHGIHCNLKLEDGSTFAMVLSDKGSDAKGNREEIHILAGEKSAFIKDFESYTFSNKGKKIRFKSAKKLDVFSRMYDTIFRNLAEEIFDNFSETLRTQRVLLKLDDALGEPK